VRRCDTTRAVWTGDNRTLARHSTLPRMLLTRNRTDTADAAVPVLEAALHRRGEGGARPPAFVLGGINLVRPLAIASIPVVLGTDDEDEPALRSRYVMETCRLPSPVAAPRDAVDALLRAGTLLRYRVGARLPLIVGRDDWLGLLHRHRAAIERHFTFLACDSDLGEVLLDKARFHELALARGLPVPRRFDWDDASGELRRHAGPVIAKPRLKLHWSESPALRALNGRYGKGVVYPGPEALLGDGRLAPFRELFIVQEYVPGRDDALVSYHGLADEGGRVLASFVGRKLRTSPPRTGDSSLIELVRHPAAEEAGRRIVEALGLKGPFKLDLKEDERDGAIRLIEVNARFSLWNHLGAANGVDLLSMAYRYLVEGARPRPGGYGTRVRWLDLALDYRAFRQLQAEGALSTAAWLRSIVFTRKIHSVFRWDDPWPACHRWLAWGRRRLRQWLFTAS
jgi:D-aspartate ligase